MIKLSILIATMPHRKDQFRLLLGGLYCQLMPINYPPIVEIITDMEVSYNIGVKRNKLLSRAKGEYIVFIDDDDSIDDSYVASILWAICYTPDCIGISGTYRKDMGAMQQWHISKEYGSWRTENGVYLRTPNHISPVRRELALQAGFPPISHGEDAEYSRRLLPFLKSEIIIPGNIYHYEFTSQK